MYEYPNRLAAEHRASPEALEILAADLGADLPPARDEGVPEWARLGAIAAAMNLHPDSLERRRMELGLERREVAGEWSNIRPAYIRTADLAALLGDESRAAAAMRALESGRLGGLFDRWVDNWRASDALGLASDVAGQVARLRGVPYQPYAGTGAHAYAMPGLEALRRRLDAEAALEPDPADRHDAAGRIGPLRAAMHVQYAAGSWDEDAPDREDPTRRPSPEEVRHRLEREATDRLRTAGIRHGRGRGGRFRVTSGPITFSGFDAFRLLGLLVDRRREPDYLERIEEAAKLAAPPRRSPAFA